MALVVVTVTITTMARIIALATTDTTVLTPQFGLLLHEFSALLQYNGCNNYSNHNTYNGYNNYNGYNSNANQNNYNS